MGKVTEFDGLRWLMAMWVYISHVLFLSELHLGRVFGILAQGGSAVSVFIMVSGFAIATTLIKSKSRYSDYIAKRFFRIYPIYIVALVLGIFTSHLFPTVLQNLPWHNESDLARIAARTVGEDQNFFSYFLPHLLLLHGAVPDTWLYGASLAFNGPLWSLSLEWQFYLVAPFMVAVFVAPDRRWIFASLLILLGVYGARFDPYFSQVPSFLPQRISLFVVGILTAIYLDKLRKNPELIFAAAAMLLVASDEALALSIWCLVVAAVTLRNNPVAKLGGAILRNNFLVWLGERSYGFYAIHYPILLVWAYILQQWGYSGGKVLFAALLLLTLPVTITVAAASYALFELPIHDWARRRFSSRRHAVAVDLPLPTRAPGAS